MKDEKKSKQIYIFYALRIVFIHPSPFILYPFLL